MPSITEEKALLRRRVREQLRAMDPAALRASDDALFARFLALPQLEEAKTVFAFWGIPGREPETGRLVPALLERGKRVCLPRMLPGRQMELRLYDPARPMVPAAFGILEPGEDCPLADRGEVDLILVPAVCYDRRGYRLGFGGGYYDRWMEGFSGIRAGLCRERVLRERIPVEAHDCRVDLLLTEWESLSFPGRENGRETAPPPVSPV